MTNEREAGTLVELVDEFKLSTSRTVELGQKIVDRMRHALNTAPIDKAVALADLQRAVLIHLSQVLLQQSDLLRAEIESVRTPPSRDPS